MSLLSSRGLTDTPFYKRIRGLDSFHHRNFRFVWLAHWGHVGAEWSISVIIGWLTFEVTNSPLLTATVIGVGAAPIIFVGPIAGVLLDAWDRKALLAGSLLLQFIGVISIALVILLDLESIWNVFAFSIINGGCGALYFSAVNVIIPNVVPTKKLVNAFSLVHMVDGVTRILTPFISGLLIGWIGPGLSLIMPATCLFAGFLFCTRVELSQRGFHRIGVSSSYIDIVVASKYIWFNKTILGFIVIMVAPSFFIAPVNLGLMPVYAAEVFKSGPWALGLLASSLGMGMVLGTSVTAFSRDIQNLGRVTMLAMGGMALGLFLFSRTNNLLFAIGVLVPYGSMITIFWTIAGAGIQSIVPDRLRGRVSSLSMIVHVCLPIGTLGVGILSEAMGVQSASVICAAALGIFLVLALIFFPSTVRYRINEEN